MLGFSGARADTDGLVGLREAQRIVLFRITHTSHWRSFGGFRKLLELGHDDFSGNR